MEISQAQQAAELIENAVEIIDNEGWTQGTLHSDSYLNAAPTTHCMIGGLLKAATGMNAVIEPIGSQSYTTAVTAVSSSVYAASKGSYIPDYNDEFGRTWDECREVMISAAKTLREQG